MIDKNIILGISIGIITGILLSFVIFLNVTPYRYGHVINYFTTLYPSSTQESTVPPTEVVPSIESDILLPIELTSWLDDNLTKTDIGYSASAEEFSRLNLPAYREDISYHLDNLDEQLNNRRDFIVTTLNLNSPERNAPVNIELNQTILQSFNGAEYEIEVFSWEAYPDFFIPSTIYKPLDANQEQLPALLIPTGCPVHIAWHDENTSVERRAANFALSGFLVFNVPTGLCRQGIVGEQFENATSYDEFALAGGSGLTTNQLGVTMLMRAIDLLENRADVDDSRIGITGYSYGGGMSTLITSLDTRIDAAAIVATDLFNNTSDTNIYTEVRHATITAPYPDSFDISGHIARDAHTQNEIDFGSYSISDLFYPRPVYFVMGDNDPGTPLASVNVGFDSLQNLYGTNPEIIQPRLDIVEGVHNYDPSRRRLVIEWFIDIFDAEPILALPDDADEHATELLGRDTLENEPPNFGEVTLRDIFVASARRNVEQQQAIFPLIERDNPRQFLQDILLLNGEWQSKRPIILEERVFHIDDQPVSVTFAILQLQSSFQARALVLEPSNASINNVHLFITTSLYPLTTDLIPSDVGDILDRGEPVVIIYPIGFAPLYSYQYRTYMLSSLLESRSGTTLLGLGVEALMQGINLSHSVINDSADIILHVDGVDAQNIGLFTSAIYDNIDLIIIENGVNSFADFFDAPTNPIPPPTLAINGIMAYVDIQSLIDMSSTEVIIESTGDLHEFRPYHHLIRY